MKSKSLSMLIDGRLSAGQSQFAVINPANEEVAGTVPEATENDVEAALQAAGKGFAVWSQTPLAKRREVMLRYADLLEQHRARIVDLLIAETGKPVDNAEYDFGMLTTCLRFFPEEAARIRQEVIPDPDGRFLNYIMRQPLGVVVGYLAWNFPLLNFGYKLGPLLAAGCAAVIKPSSLTPLATLAAAELSIEAGLPPGVINVITSTNHAVTNPLLRSPLTAMVTMIGSTESGVKIMGDACNTVKHFSVELGGNAPVVVYDDADVAMAAEKTVDLKFANTGQVCVSPNRCFVHARVYEQFLEAAAARAAGIRLVAGRGEGRMMGPMLTDSARQRVLGLVEQAVSAGATIVCGGKVPAQPAKGFWLLPTILRDVQCGMSVACDEIFGPVLPVLRFDDDDDVLKLANQTQYGLAAYVFTRDLGRGLRAAAGIQAGSVCVNEPHYAVHLPHGGLKQSGVGKDCSHYSIEEYFTTKRVSILTE
jgi:succinate-semialdehyde dehydrogenase / glutarate-semialdehyde dehydrogenase